MRNEHRTSRCAQDIPMISLHSRLHAIALHGVRALRRGLSLNRLYHPDSGEEDSCAVLCCKPCHIPVYIPCPSIRIVHEDIVFNRRVGQGSADFRVKKKRQRVGARNAKKLDHVSATHDDQSTLGASDMQPTREGKCTIMLIN